MSENVKKILTESDDSVCEKIKPLCPLITWTVLTVVPLCVCVILDVLLVINVKLPWDPSQEKCHPMLSGMFFYFGLFLFYYELRKKQPKSACIRKWMVSLGMLFVTLYLIDMLVLIFWFVTYGTENLLPKMILLLLDIPISWFYLRYFYRELVYLIPLRMDEWKTLDFAQTV